MTPTNGYPIDPGKLRAARLAAGLTVVQLGQQSKTVTARVVSYEAGESTPTITTLHRLAATLDVAPTELMAPRGDGPVTFLELRARAAITQPEIAAQLGLPSPVHYSHLEIGQSPSPPPTSSPTCSRFPSPTSPPPTPPPAGTANRSGCTSPHSPTTTSHYPTNGQLRPRPLNPTAPLLPHLSARRPRGGPAAAPHRCSAPASGPARRPVVENTPRHVGVSAPTSRVLANRSGTVRTWNELGEGQAGRVAAIGGRFTPACPATSLIGSKPKLTD